MSKIKSIAIFILIFLAFLSSCSTATKNVKSHEGMPYLPASKELFDTIAHMDSVMFGAFNAHDLDRLKTTFSEDLEFYHDKGGLADYKQSMENFKSLFERNKNTGLRRDLVKGSLEVYPIKDYGAVEICAHRFCHVENGKDDCGTFKNIMIWQKKDGQWKVTRVISYDH
jgi:hypothetical protein